MLAIVGLSFFLFAAWSVRGDTIDEESGPQRSFPLMGAFGVVGASFFVSELGDKTLLATVTLASDRPDLVGIWLGSTLGMAADALAIGVGIVAGGRLPQRAIAVGAALLFCVFGVAAFVKAAVG